MGKVYAYVQRKYFHYFSCLCYMEHWQKIQYAINDMLCSPAIKQINQ